MEHETVWITQAQMAELFQKDRTVISRHIRNVFNEGELEEKNTCAKFAHICIDETVYHLGTGILQPSAQGKFFFKKSLRGSS